MIRRLTGFSVITQDVRRLSDFYRQVLGVELEGDDTYAAYSMGGITLSFFAQERMEQMAPGSMKGAGRGACVLEFEVQDVDQEYERLTGLGLTIVKPPTTQPWGLRSVWFRDPDGNIVNFFAPAPAG